MLNGVQRARGFFYEVEGQDENGRDLDIFTLTFEGRPIANKLADEELGPQADITWERVLLQRRTFIDQDGEV